MAKPRIFVSSTYYDLKHIRNTLEAFIDSFGYEAVLFESGDIPFHHDQSLDESCYAEIKNCHMLVLIIGGRYGSATSDSERPIGSELEAAYEYFNSITKKEYESARKRDIPIYIFVEKNVLAEYQTYKDNLGNESVKYAHVDNVNVYRLLDNILGQRRNNFVREFEKFGDISSWLRDQWAGLFADFLSQKKTETSLKDMSSQITQLRSVSKVLKEYTESMMRKIQPDGFQEIIDQQVKRLRINRMRRFAHEPFIEYLSDNMVPDNNTPAKRYLAFEQSKTLRDFLKRTGLSKLGINEFMETDGPQAKREYTRLRKQYLEMEDVDDNIE